MTSQNKKYVFSRIDGRGVFYFRHNVFHINKTDEIFKFDWTGKEISKKADKFSWFCVYDGEFSNGLPHGKGKLYFVNKTRKDHFEYEGDWFTGLRHGFGNQTWNDGTKYHG